jgi:hypothetical protein
VIVHELAGRVVVVAGERPELSAVIDAAVAAGASVAIVSRTLGADLEGDVRFRADPTDPAVWDRVAMHVEQHLGPVDGVVTDADAASVVLATFDADLARRGHGAVVVAGPDERAEDVLSRSLDTRRATPAPPRPGASGP